MTAAEESFRAGDLGAALQGLQAQIRQQPADVKLRVFLAQLLMVGGQWDRALTQLQVVEEMDSQSLPMVRTYQRAIQCERLRTSVFAGERAPLLLGEPEPWLALLIQSVGLHGKGRLEQAAQLRAQAFAEAPETSGTLNGERFAWLADGDSRLGPVLEVLLNGNYYWVPVHRIRAVTLQAPEDIRDLVWMPATFVWTNDGDAMGLIPTRYPYTEDSAGDALRLSRKTEWTEPSSDCYVGIGQRVLVTDTSETGLLQVRELNFDVPAA